MIDRAELLARNRKPRVPGGPAPGMEKRLAKRRDATKWRVRNLLCKNVPTTESSTCELCGEVPRDGVMLDHDHETGLFRGWLCRRCNTGLGYLGDNFEGLERAIRYLKRNCVTNSECIHSTGKLSTNDGTR